MTAFKLRHGIGPFWPFAGIAGDASGYHPQPYWLRPWDQHLTPDKYAQVKDAGFDHLRVQINHGPMMEAIRKGDAARLEMLFKQFDVCVDQTVTQGLGVVIDLYLTGYKRDFPDQVLSDDTQFANYKDTAAAFARRYADRDPALTALEHFNEPPGNPSNWYADRQVQLYDAMREAAPNLTLILSPTDWSSHFEFLKLTPAQVAHYDANTRWTVHPFIPSPAALQGYVGSQYRYIVGLNYPPNPADKAGAIADMRARVNADANAPAGMINQLTADLNYYFDIPQDRHWILAEMRKVAAHAQSLGIGPDRIYAGEWGMTRECARYRGGSKASRVAYYADVRWALDQVQFADAVIHLDTDDYGLTTGGDGVIGPWDAQLIAAAHPTGGALSVPASPLPARPPAVTAPLPARPPAVTAPPPAPLPEPPPPSWPIETKAQRKAREAKEKATRKAAERAARRR